MADDDYPTNFPAGPAVDPTPTAKQTTDPHADPYPSVPPDQPDPPSTSSQSIEGMERDLWQMEKDMMLRNQQRDSAIDQQSAPIREALLKEAAQPLPQPPSMSEVSPYGPPPTQDPQSQRGGILAGILYGVLGLGLAKVFAGRNKSAYYGAMEGIGEALKQRNAGNQTAANQNFERWVKLNELWHQQLRDRMDDYKTTLENRRLSEQQKLDMLSVIANQHGNVQSEAAARRGDMELLQRQIDHLDKMREAQQKQADKIQESWAKQMGNTDLDRAYKNFLRGKGINSDNRAEYEAAQQTQGEGEKDVSYYTFWQKNRQKPTAAQSEEAAKEESDKELRDQMKTMFPETSPARGQKQVTVPAAPPPTTSSLPSGGGSNRLLPGSD